MLAITGGGGFIGSVLAWALNEAGRADIVIADRFGHDEKWRNLAKRDFFEIVTIEALPAWLDRFGGEVEAVFHLGANSSTHRNRRRPHHRHQPQRFDRAVALVRRPPETADLRFVGGDLWRRHAGFRRCRAASPN